MELNNITLLLYLMVIPISILVFCDVVLVKNNIYLILHIILVIIYLVFFYFFNKYIQRRPIELDNNSIIPSAPPIIPLATLIV
jgi:Ca2+/Na+ antiporter